MLGPVIFLILCFFGDVMAIICALGWMKADQRNAGMNIANSLLSSKVHSQEKMLEKLRAENNFLRLQLEEKKDEQKSN